MGDGGDGGIGGGTGADLGTSLGSVEVPDGGHSIVVNCPDSGGILWGTDGSGSVVLPQRPLRPDEYPSDDEPAGSDDPPAPDDSTV